MDSKNNIQQSRDKVIVKTGVIGIIVNLILSAFKAVIGIISNSIAIILDAVNNISDALSSIITIVGAKLSAKKPNKKHPMGYGRIEYLSTMVVASIILYAGITSMLESVKKIIHPEQADYSVTSLIIVASAVIVKLFLGRYVKNIGTKVNSGSLIASGKDALFDAILSASVLLSAIIYILFDISLEAYVGLIISVIIIKSAFEMFSETIDEILGKRVDKKYLAEIKKTICSDECVRGAFDLILHNYGPEKYIGSVHVEIPDNINAEEIDAMERRIAHNVFEKHGIILAGIGIYAINTHNDTIKSIRSDIIHTIMSNEYVLETHGFYIDLEKKSISLDVILDFDADDREQILLEIRKQLQQKYPDYKFLITMDIDI